jgi:signal transduction histidine kinase
MGRKDSNTSLVLRLVRSASYWALPILIFTAFALTFFYRDSTYRIFDDPLTSAVTSLIASADIPEGGTAASLTLAREPTDPRYQQALSGRYWLIGLLETDGNVIPIKKSRSLYEDTLRLPARDAQQIRARPGEEIASKSIGPDGEPLRVLVNYVTLPNANNQAVVIIAAADNRPATQAVRRFALIASGLMFLLSAGLVTAVFTQVRSGLKPLFDLRDTVADVREGRATHVEGEYPREIQPLATELNFLIDHNKDIVEHARTHVGNLAHALKTPLAVLINESDAQAPTNQFASIVARQIQIMRKQVDHHLHRARAAARGQAIGVSTDVAPVINSLARTLPRIFRSKDIDMIVDIEADLAFRGEKRDLDEMVGNLMDNACKWSRSQVRVFAYSKTSDPTNFVISVEDDGPGLKETDYAQALKRGVRRDEAKPGTGFGLAIVDDLARAYKGGVEFSRSEWGGLCVTLLLPKTSKRSEGSGL